MKLFACVGTGLEPFDRLIAALDAAIETLIGRHGVAVEGTCQHGSCRLRSAHLHNVERMSRQAFRDAMAGADAVICHAGVGTLSTAIALGQVPLVLPRVLRHQEVVNDHQQQIADLLATRGLVATFDSAPQLAALLAHPPARRSEVGAATAAPRPLPASVDEALARAPARAARRPAQRLLLRLLAAPAPALAALRIKP